MICQHAYADVPKTKSSSREEEEGRGKRGLLLVKLEAFKDNAWHKLEACVSVDDDDDDECSENDENDDDHHHHRSKGGRDTRKARAFNSSPKEREREREREKDIVKP